MSIAIIGLLNHLLTNTDPPDSPAPVKTEKEPTPDIQPESVEPASEQAPAKTQQLNNKVLQGTVTPTAIDTLYSKAYNTIQDAKKSYQIRMEDIARIKTMVHSVPMKKSEKLALEYKIRVMEDNFKYGNWEHNELSDLNLGKVQFNILSSEMFPDAFSLTKKLAPMLFYSNIVPDNIDIMEQVYNNSLPISDFGDTNFIEELTSPDGHLNKSVKFNLKGRAIANELATHTPVDIPKGSMEHCLITFDPENNPRATLLNLQVDVVAMRRSQLPKGVNILTELPDKFIIGRLEGKNIQSLLQNDSDVAPDQTESTHVLIKKPITIPRGNDFYYNRTTDARPSSTQRINEDLIIVPKNQLTEDSDIFLELPAGSQIYDFDTHLATNQSWNEIHLDPNTDYVLLKT